MPFSVATVWIPDFQDLDLGHGRAYQGVTGLWSWIFLFLNFGTVESFLKANSTTDQALPPALLVGIQRPEFLPDPQCKLWQHSIQSELRPMPPDG